MPKWERKSVSMKSYRRKEIIEIETIKDLIKTNHIVIAGGGGGIPIYKQNEAKGANAVIDKDLVYNTQNKSKIE